MQDRIIRIPRSHPRYPELLRQLGPEEAPPDLFVRGDAALLRAALPVAVVGTRACTRYGERMAAAIADGLARAGAVVVSGLAIGVDAVAHRAALDAGGATVAVLGS